jgi:CheY-like chemotaxis protein
MSSQGSSTKRKPRNTADLARRRILIVEDSPVVGPFTADLLQELGCIAIGPAPNLAIGRQLIESEQIDAALVDVHIRGERVFPLCDALAAKNVPFVLTSGYADWNMPEKWQDRPRLQKPYTLGEVEKALKTVLGASA